MSRSKNQPVNFMAFVGFMRQFAAEIPGILERADRERLSVILSDIEKEYPDFYATFDAAADMAPRAALDSIVEAYPVAIFLTFVPNVYAIVGMAQTQIKARRKENNGRTQKD